MIISEDILVKPGEHARTYRDFPFSVKIPEVNVLDDYIIIKFGVMYRIEEKYNIAVDTCKLENGSEFAVIVHPEDQVFTQEEAYRRAKVTLNANARGFNWKNSHLDLRLFGEDGRKFTIHYNVGAEQKLSFEYAFWDWMSENEKDHYKNIFYNASKIRNDKQNEAKQELSKESDQFSDNKSRSQILQEDSLCNPTPTLQDYQAAIRKEIIYLKNHGGHRYKAVEGKWISSNFNGYSYRFELEDTLHVADLSPVSLIAGTKKTSGYVVACEDLQIYVILKDNIGESVEVAYISVEPWKLLEALNYKLSHISQTDHIAMKLIEEGPKLGRFQHYSKIPKGQDIACEMAENNDITVIWGPPGTGKTYSMAKIAIDFLKKNKTVLVVSHSNVSVDGVVKKIVELVPEYANCSMKEDGRILRYGYVRDEQLAKNHDVVAYNYTLEHCPELKKKKEDLLKGKSEIDPNEDKLGRKRLDIEIKLKNIRAQIREKEGQYVMDAQLVATTISKLNIDKIFDYRKYDVVLFDEISMAYVPQLISAAAYASEHFIAVGDFRQLAPIVQSDSKSILRKDIFDYLHITKDEGFYYHPWLVLLNEQRRMHSGISAFVNKYFYHGLLMDHASAQESRQVIASYGPYKGEALNMVDLYGSYCVADKNSDNSRFNILSAIVDFLTALSAGRDGDVSVGIITPYAAQARLIRSMIRDYKNKGKVDITCSTIHQFQGSERDVIIFDAVESYPEARVGWLMSRNENNSVTRLINVAVTRARGKLITVANSQFWKSRVDVENNPFCQLLKYTEDNGNVESISQYMEYIRYDQNIRLYNADKGAWLTQLTNDIYKAKQQILISIPDRVFLHDMGEKLYEEIVTALRRGVRIQIQLKDHSNLPEKWKEICVETEKTTFPLWIIDKTAVWYGVPLSQGEIRDKNIAYKTNCPFIARISGQNAIKLICTLTNFEYKQVNGNNKPNQDKTMQDEVKDECESAGLARFIHENIKCASCKHPMEMKKGKRGKFYLQCPSCRQIEYLTKDDINWYIRQENVYCPQDRGNLKACLGRYGVYIRCSNGHYLKPDQI